MSVSRRGRLFYAALKLFMGTMLPKNMSLKTYRRFSAQPLFEPMPRGIRRENGEVAGVPGEWITPRDAAPDRVLLYLHGGGYIVKSPRVHRILAGRLARAAGIRAFMPDYRLAPEHPFPAALEDTTAVYRGLISQGVKPSRIVVAGDSAGGGLTVALPLCLRDSGDPLPAAACLISAMLDCTFTGESTGKLQKHDPLLRISDVSMMVKHYCGDHDPRHPLISPVFADLRGLPPLFVHAAENEVLRPEAVRFADQARAADVNVTLKLWEGMVHAFPLFAGIVPEGKAAVSEIGAFFRTHLA